MLINTSKYKGNIIAPVVKPSGTLTADDGNQYDIRAMTKGVVTLSTSATRTAPTCAR